ncbi:MAG: hypothetical protein AAF218_01040 [Pseudomonadota bacterium]
MKLKRRSEGWRERAASCQRHASGVTGAERRGPAVPPGGAFELFEVSQV